MKITHEEIEPYLLDFVQNIEIPEEIDYRIRAYIQKNPDFQKELDELKETADFLKEMPLAMPSPQLSIGFYAMLAQEQSKNQDKIASVPPPIAPSASSSNTNASQKWKRVISIACILLIGFGISWQITMPTNNQIAMQETPIKHTEEVTQIKPTEKIQSQPTEDQENDIKKENIQKKEENTNKHNKFSNSLPAINNETKENITIKNSPDIKLSKIAHRNKRKANHKIIIKPEDAEMQQGISGNFSTYNNSIHNTEKLDVPMISNMPLEMDSKASMTRKQSTTSEKLAKINEAQASSGELLQLLENEQNMHIKLWAMQALDQKLKNTPDSQIAEKVAALLSSYTHVALQMATLDLIKNHNPNNKKNIIDSLLKNNNIAPIVKKQAEKLKKQ